jgi:2-polyprenyl-3-methyl-5-hydroxy-6-metoxy-1,4-benzoquinol methylase
VSLVCPLCAGTRIRPFHQDRRRDYLQCADCRLVFVPPAQRLSAEAEKAEYDLHRNDPADGGYRRFLSRLADPLLARLAPHSCGLDFGCGPGPTLSLMLAEAGHRVALYDPFYARDPQVLVGQQYDFITATEVVEHLHHPGRELEQLWRLLRPGGVLGLMTKLVIGADAFARWHYKNDQTHVCFFSRETFQWLAASWGAQLEILGKDVILLTRPIH